MVLIDGLPQSLKVGGKEFEIDVDFRLWLLLDELLFDKEIKENERAGFAKLLVFGDENINISQAFEQILWFYSCGEQQQKQRKRENKGIKEKAYDYRADWGLIYAAFLQAYNIDLTKKETGLHWWQFRALFNALPEDCNFVKIMGYRTMDLSKISNKGQRQAYMRLKEIYRLGNGMTTEEKAANAGALFAPR